MAEKLTTIDQLKMLALRTKTDSAARISELAEMIAAGLEDSQIGFTVTLLATNWSGGTQKIQHEFLLAGSRYWYLIYSEANVKADDITVDGQITFRCEAAPETDLSIYIIRLEIA